MTVRHIALAMALALALAAGACEGTDRPLSYEKGVYGGKADEPLRPEQVEALRQRALEQWR